MANGMSVNRIVKLFNDNPPMTINDVRKLGVSARLIGCGLYRRTYKIKNSPWVIKIPHDETNIPHGMAEYDAVQTCLRSRADKAAAIRPYLPSIEYFNDNSGISIMEYIVPLDKTKTPKRIQDGIVNMMEDLIESLWPLKFDEHYDKDLHRGNMGINKYGYFKILDLGYFLPDGQC
jgi:hypothetical protein